jgi:hypothetical protein
MPLITLTATTSSKGANIQNILRQVSAKTGIAKSPTEIFYLSLSQIPHLGEVTLFNQASIGPTNATQSSISPLYKDSTLRTKFGKSTSIVTLFGINKPSTNPNNLYNASVSTIYKTPKGDIEVSHSPMLQRFPNFYGLPYNQIEIAPITFGTGVYLNKTGFVCIASSSTTVKLIMVFIL